MSPAERAFSIKRALMQSLADCGSFAVTELALREQAAIKIDHLRPTVAEIDGIMKRIEQDRLFVALPSERGVKMQITDAGLLWLAAHA